MNAHYRAPSLPFSRRALLQGAAQLGTLWALGAGRVFANLAAPAKAEPFPLQSVHLTASPYLTAVEANKAYLHSLEPDRLLHNFREQAGLPPKGEKYGGWEGDS